MSIIHLLPIIVLRFFLKFLNLPWDKQAIELPWAKLPWDGQGANETPHQAKGAISTPFDGVHQLPIFFLTFRTAATNRRTTQKRVVSAIRS